MWGILVGKHFENRISSKIVLKGEGAFLFPIKFLLCAISNSLMDIQASKQIVNYTRRQQRDKKNCVPIAGKTELREDSGTGSQKILRFSVSYVNYDFVSMQCIHKVSSLGHYTKKKNP